MLKMLKNMNLPNKLTLIRIFLVPVFIVFMALPTEWIWPLYVALGVFVIAAITDKLDGDIARKNNIVTNFGKIMDPLADKLIVSAGFVMLVGLGVIPAWMIAFVIVRDFFVNGLRMFGADNNKDLAAGLSGKIKTVFQMIAIPLGILGVALNSKYSAFGIFFEKSMIMDTFELLVNILMTVSVAAVVLATACSLVDYILRFKEDLEEKEDSDDTEENAENEDIDEDKQEDEDSSNIDEKEENEETVEKIEEVVVEEEPKVDENQEIEENDSTKKEQENNNTSNSNKKKNKKHKK